MNNLDELTKKPNEIELKQLMGNLTMDVIARCAFASKTDTYADPNNQFIKSAEAIFQPTLWKMILLSALPSFLSKIQGLRGLISPATNSFFFIDVSRNIMKQRK